MRFGKFWEFGKFSKIVKNTTKLENSLNIFFESILAIIKIFDRFSVEISTLKNISICLLLISEMSTFG